MRKDEAKSTIQETGDKVQLKENKLEEKKPKAEESLPKEQGSSPGIETWRGAKTLRTHMRWITLCQKIEQARKEKPIETRKIF